MRRRNREGYWKEEDEDKEEEEEEEEEEIGWGSCTTVT